MLPPAPGTVGWVDLTVPDAVAVRDFYRGVVGFTATPVSMGDYSDYCLHPSPGANPVAGVCHARGPNADLPAVWLVYFTVDDVAASARAVVELGGELLVPPRHLGGGLMCVLRDPAGAIAALYQPAAAAEVAA